MSKLDLFRRQFLFTKQNHFELPWTKFKIRDFYLYIHPELEISHISNDDIELYLLGFIYDYEDPSCTNLDILLKLSNSQTIEDLIENLAVYSGHFAIIFSSIDSLILLNDACAQFEIYYDTSLSNFGSQPKLLGKVIQALPYQSGKSADFYSSSLFHSWRIFIGETTHLENIKHLRSNHYINITQKSISRYFPKNVIHPISIENASTIVAAMLKGFIKAAALRNKIYMPVTAGWDSRVLFFASLDLDCQYYITKLKDMGDRHYDIVVPKRLTKSYNKNFAILTEVPYNEKDQLILNVSIDFARKQYKSDTLYKDHVNINGNISEIGRNYYGCFSSVSSEELSILYGLPSNSFASNQFEKWLEANSQMFLEMGFNTLDMFYWEEKMGNWAAKAKTEMNSLGIPIYSPFCSHKLLETLLSTPRDSRDKHLNKLYTAIIHQLVSEAKDIPINPTTKNTIKILLKKIGIYHTYEATRLKVRNRYSTGFNKRIKRYKILS
jgi:hypothetical protein